VVEMLPCDETDERAEQHKFSKGLFDDQVIKQAAIW